MNKLKVSAIALAAAVGLAACGGGSKNNDAPVDAAPSTETRTFEGSFIDGANYVSGARSGVTGLDCADIKPGCFDVLSAGDSVTFTLGSIELPPITTAAGINRVTTLDIARAIDPEADPNSLAFKAVYAVLAALDEGTDPMDGEVKIFKVKPAAEGASVQVLKAIVDEATAPNAEDGALEAALAGAIAESTGEPFEPNQVDLAAGDESEIATEFNEGFKGGLQPKGFFRGDNAQHAGFNTRGSLSTADLLGRWTVSYEEGADVEVSGAFFNDGGTFDTAETLAGSNFASISLGAAWNVVDRVFTVKIDASDAGADCFLTERNENSSVLTFACREQDEDNANTVVDTELTLTKADDLLTVLTAGDGTWNEVFEARFYGEGEEPSSTVKFGPGNTLTINDGEQETGTFSLNGLMLFIEIGTDEVTCYFAGRQPATAPNTIGGIFLRCFEGDDISDSEDVLLTKENVTQPLANSNEPPQSDTVSEA